MKPGKFRVRHPEVEAYLITAENMEWISGWAGGTLVRMPDREGKFFTAVSYWTLSGRRFAVVDQFLVRDYLGRLQAWDSEDFSHHFESA